MDEEATDKKKASGQEPVKNSTYWQQKLMEAEEADPDRCVHAGTI